MQLVNNSGRYEAITKDYMEGRAPKAAGFRWDRDAGRWWTNEAVVAVRLAEFADEPLKTELLTSTAAKREAAEASLAASRATDADVEIPCAAGRAFLPYQRAGIAFALAHRNVLIGDDMGLGKTAQAIGVLNADESLKRVLVICPASLTRNWVREIGFFGSRPLSVGIATTKAVPDTDIVIATYDVFSRSTPAAETLLAATWDALILDEAHYLKNGDAKRTKAILGGGDEAGIRVAKRRIYLTGTPVTNRPIELWPLVHSLAHDEFDNKLSFAKRYCAAHRNGFGWDFSGASNLDELQDKLRATVMVRRLKRDVLTELPPKRRQVIELAADTPALRAVLKAEAEAEAMHGAELSRLRANVAAASENPAAYKAAVAALKAGRMVEFTEMSRVRHQTAVAKAPAVAEHVREVVEAGGKVIVFAHHKDVVQILRDALSGLGCVEITGDTSPAKRQGIVDQFQNREDTRVFIGNIQAAGVGLTLTASAHVVFAELDWTPGNLSQAEDRAHRLGQRNAVLVQHLVLEGSLDARMARTVLEKQEVIDAALDDVEDPVDRERRIAEIQGRFDAGIEEALLDAKVREAEEAQRSAEREARALAAAERAVERAAVDADWRALRASVAAKAEEIGGEAMDPETVAAIHAGLRLLAGMDLDHASERNNAGFSKLDSYHGHFLAALDELSGLEAVVGRGLIRRYQRQLPADLLAAALGHAVTVQVNPIHAGATPEAEVAIASAPVAETQPAVSEASVSSPVPMGTEFPLPEARRPEFCEEPTVSKRGRGRPRIGDEPLSKSERNKRWRETNRISALEIPAAIAERLRRLREERGISNADILAAALDALSASETPPFPRTAAISPDTSTKLDA